MGRSLLYVRDREMGGGEDIGFTLGELLCRNIV